ncbi:16S rRNA (guanine(527)-N(7))-methyltransferase RsmG [Desulfogranum japonicum]|uniref:16S rRNA (guanine(527)-N(7))-methyltransferase RsmG n=1 Tax=Desulfogranum japonicum TaxID=231447 RepID=UPI000427DA5A|nr:16S rRNA (guanine(527)-N(7))-methyltransferase RsmG [Desulfogranum japonicum]
MSQKVESLLVRGIEQLGLKELEKAVPGLLIYIRELKKWGQRINLIARESSDQQIVEHHFLDSLSLLSLVDFQSSDTNLLDVGTGGGFPGLVLAVSCPQAKFTLVEPRQKRVVFLRHIIRTLQLENVQVYGKRLEQVPEIQGAHVTHVTSRAVAPPLEFLEMVEPLMHTGCQAVVMMAREERYNELADQQNRFSVVRTVRLQLPLSGAQRILALVRASL